VIARILATLSIAFTASTAVAAEPACAASEYRQFDFWLGVWNVHTPAGKLAGVNKISSEYGGCVLHERYSSTGAYTGESLNTYDAGRKLWHQTWVDNAGTLLLLEGGLRGQSMVLEGQMVETDGQVTKHRITWTPNTDGTVRQHWESTDSKGQRKTLFDGTYTKK
jgi:hypothetical protein